MRETGPVPADTRLRATGRFLALVGPTGSGKSTLAGLLLRSHEAQQGTLTMGGVPLSEIADADFHRLVAYVPQDPFLLTGSLASNIDFGFDANRTQIEGAAARAGLVPFVRSLLQEALHALKGEVSMVIIAHRLSTLRDADEILVLARGRLQGRGTRDALIARGGLYRRGGFPRRQRRLYISEDRQPRSAINAGKSMKFLWYSVRQACCKTGK